MVHGQIAPKGERGQSAQVLWLIEVRDVDAELGPWRDAQLLEVRLADAQAVRRTPRDGLDGEIHEIMVCYIGGYGGLGGPAVVRFHIAWGKIGRWIYDLSIMLGFVPEGLESHAASLGSIFAGNTRVCIPDYQRGFSWRNDNINRLWDDIIDTLAEAESERTLFLGSLVFHEDEGNVDLVDGQQRLTTLTMLLGNLRHRLMAAERFTPDHGRVVTNIERIIFVRGREKDGVRLHLSKKDRETYSKALQSNALGAGAAAGVSRGWRRLNSLLDEREEEGDFLEFAEAVFDLITDLAKFSRVIVRAPHSPFAVFEALNSTGQDLAQGDLIKNRVLERTTDSWRDDFFEKWERMVTRLPEGEVSKYLRAWWIAEEKFTSVKQLYNNVKRKVKTHEDAQEYLDRWHDDALQYAHIVTGTPNGYCPPNVKAAVEDFVRLDFQQGRPIMLAFMLNDGQKYLPDVVHELARVYVRVLKTAQQRGSKFENKVESICRTTREDSPSSGLEKLRADVDSLIREIGPMDWTHFHVEEIPFARYLLATLTKRLEGGALGILGTADVEVEHVFPQKRPEGLLDSTPEAEYQRLTTHIGNLTFLTKEDNIRASNKPPDEKMEIYQEYLLGGRTPLKLTGDIVGRSPWSEESLVARSAWLAEIANEIW